MDAAQTIRNALTHVATLRAEVQASPALQQRLEAIKRFQARRFAGTYHDLLHSSTWAAPTRFFLEELYGEQDFANRDNQFARIAGALQTFFPEQVVATAVALAQLHTLTESLDMEMAQRSPQAIAENGLLSSAAYVQTWRTVASPKLRQQQLQAVLDVGLDLDHLTRTKGLRIALRMMRGPAKAAGLSALQSFLEAGFDTFAGMGGKGQEARQFIDTIRMRETEWITTLFQAPLADSITRLDTCLTHAPDIPITCKH